MWPTKPPPSPIACIRCSLNCPVDPNGASTVEVPFCEGCLRVLGNPKTVEELMAAVVRQSTKLGPPVVEKCLYIKLLYVWLYSKETPYSLYAKGRGIVQKMQGEAVYAKFMGLPGPNSGKQPVNIPGVTSAKCAVEGVN